MPLPKYLWKSPSYPTLQNQATPQNSEQQDKASFAMRIKWQLASRVPRVWKIVWLDKGSHVYSLTKVSSNMQTKNSIVS